MTYTITILRRAQKELGALSRQDDGRVRDAIRALAADPRPPGCLRLSGRDGWRIRIGNCRVIYEIDDLMRTVVILQVGDRKDVYR